MTEEARSTIAEETEALRAAEIRRAYLARGVLLLATALGYGLSCAREVYWYDSAEYVGAAVTLGIPHPPGSPLYVLVAHMFTWLPLEPAFAVNSMSAFFGVVAVQLVFAVSRRMGASVAGATLGASILATSELFWAQCVVAEVYTMALCVALGVFWLLLVARATRRFRYALAAAFLAGLGLGVHYGVATLGLAWLWLVIALDAPYGSPRQVAGWLRKLPVSSLVPRGMACVLAALIGAANLGWVWFRGQSGPSMSGEEIGATDRFLWFIGGGEFGNLRSSEHFVDGLLVAGEVFASELTVLGIALAITGLGRLLVRDFSLGLALILAMFGNLVWFAPYDVHDQAVFFLPATAVLCLAVPVGLDATVGFVRTRLAEHPRGPLLASVVAIAPIVLIALRGPLTFEFADLSDYQGAREFGDEVADTVQPESVILVQGVPNEWYGMAVFHFHDQLVDGVRPDVEVVIGFDEEDLLEIWAKERPVYLFAKPLDALEPFIEIEQQGPVFRITSVNYRRIDRGRAP